MRTGEAGTPEGMRLYAVGDTHGHLALARALFNRIEADLASAPVKRHRIVMLGDYCDRGPETRGLIDFLIERQNRHDMVFLLGNHDQRLVEFPDMADEIGEAFLHFGGRETLASYGVDADGASSLRAAGKAFARAMPASHRRFFENALLSHEEGDYFFCHAGVKPGVPLAAQELLQQLRPAHALGDHVERPQQIAQRTLALAAGERVVQVAAVHHADDPVQAVALVGRRTAVPERLPMFEGEPEWNERVVGGVY